MLENKAKISIVIVTWNIKEILRMCLDSIDQYADLPYELFIIDNNSTDGTRDFLAVYKPKNTFLTHYEVIYNNRNLGYSTAANKGMTNATADYVLLLNPDARLVQPSLQKMVEVAEGLPDVGVLGFRILLPNGKTQWSISKLPRIKNIILSRLGLFKMKFNYDMSATVEQINAAVALIPRRVLDTVGLWDSGFFIWFEENDFCYRARKAGFKIYYSPEVRVMHESQAGIAKIPKWRKQLLWQKSMFRYFRKHHGFAQAIATSVIDPICMILGIVLRKIKNQIAKIKSTN